MTPDDPIEVIESVARAYGARWLVVERGDAARALAPVLAGDAAAVDRGAGFRGRAFGWRAAAAGVLSGLRHRGRHAVRMTTDGRVSPTSRRRRRPMSRREAVLSAALVFVVALVVRAWAATQITFPRPEDVAYYVGVARNLARGPRARHRRDLELRDAAAVLPAARLRGLAAPAVLPRRRSRWPSSGRPSPRRRSRRSSSGRLVCVLAWRLAADVAIARSMPIGRARTLALGHGAGQRRSTCRSCSPRSSPTRRCRSPRSSSARAC